jgi:hypothetical protein
MEERRGGEAERGREKRGRPGTKEREEGEISDGGERRRRREMWGERRRREMWERGVHHSGFQTKIELHFGGFFHQMKVRQPIGRQDSMQTGSEQAGVGVIFA